MLTASCASLPRPWRAASPRVDIPEAATRPCKLYTLPAAPSIADLEAGYVERGANLLACDLARKLAVDTLLAQQFAENDRRRSGR